MPLEDRRREPKRSVVHQWITIGGIPSMLGLIGWLLLMTHESHTKLSGVLAHQQQLDDRLQRVESWQSARDKTLIGDPLITMEVARNMQSRIEDRVDGIERRVSRLEMGSP